jgi:hypothetical protein
MEPAGLLIRRSASSSRNSLRGWESDLTRPDLLKPGEAVGRC